MIKGIPAIAPIIVIHKIIHTTIKKAPVKNTNVLAAILF
ncbi:hypothetical protein IK1_02917 [Bacillus cereus VD146]|uniref:Uncharacterized protein n=1 Tax=Bacillus cereus (strain VD146) TaxID=1053236 RepID=R8MS06_BACCX|nr:hypothetical protein IK1_02917 [Bacillus cereus VD146]